MRPLPLTIGLLSLTAATTLSADTSWPAPIQALVE